MQIMGIIKLGRQEENLDDNAYQTCLKSYDERCQHQRPFITQMLRLNSKYNLMS